MFAFSHTQDATWKRQHHSSPTMRRHRFVTTRLSEMLRVKGRLTATRRGSTLKTVFVESVPTQDEARFFPVYHHSRSAA